MTAHHVKPQRSGERTPREHQLAWQIARMASGPAKLDADAAEMAALRIIDNWAVALAALNRPPVVAARGAATAHPFLGGASVIGQGPARFDPFWAGYANATAIRELDFNDSFFAVDSSHPSDAIGSIAAVAEAHGLAGPELLKGIVTAYEVQVALTKGIALNKHRIDHVAHLGPAIAAGLGAMLGLSTEIIYHAVGLSAHLSVSTRQTRKGQISSYKANAPGHVGQIAMLALDRAMRGETSPAPVYEGDYGLMAILLGGPDSQATVDLPEPDEPRRAILETYSKAYSAGYHGQALIDLAFRMRDRIGDETQITDIAIHTKELTHLVMGSGANDPEKWDPAASRETLDHSAMFIFALALQDGAWDHEASYLPDRIGRPDTVALWRKIRTVSDPEWTSAFTDPAPLDKAHGGRVVATYADGTTLEDELRVADAHPRGASPFGSRDYHAKFHNLAEAVVAAPERDRFLSNVDALVRDDGAPVDLSIQADDLAQAAPGLFR